MKALILAAGEGTRLRPLTATRPKPMLMVDGKPVLEHTIGWLRRFGICEIAINLHYLPEAVSDYFKHGEELGVSLTYSREEEILGTAGAIRKLEHFFDDTFVLMYGDVLTGMDLDRLIRFHRSRKARMTLSLYQVANPSECGIVELSDDGRIRRMVEKPRPEEVFSDLAMAGVLVLEPEIVSMIPPGRFYDVGFHLIPQLLAGDIPVYGLPLLPEEYLIDIGSHGKYQQACAEWPDVQHRRQPVPTC